MTHRILLGDALDLLPTITERIDALATDPPYCLSNRMGSVRGTHGHRKLQWEFDRKADPLRVRRALRLAFTMARNAVWCFAGHDYLSGWMRDARRAGLTVKPAAWVKPHPPPAGDGNWWPSGFELAFYGYRPGAWFGDDDPKRSNVFTHDAYRHGQPGKVAHPTQKPLALMRRIVQAICPPGGLVLDPFAGSATTGLACLQTGRRFLGMEIDPVYHALAEKRLRLADGPLFAEQAGACQDALLE